MFFTITIHTMRTTLLRIINLRLILSLIGLIFFGGFALPTIGNTATGSVVYTYDALGRLTSASYDTGVIIYYTYDANGNRLSQVININNSIGQWNSFNWAEAQWGQ